MVISWPQCGQTSQSFPRSDDPGSMTGRECNVDVACGTGDKSVRASVTLRPKLLCGLTLL